MINDIFDLMVKKKMKHKNSINVTDLELVHIINRINVHLEYNFEQSLFKIV